MTTKKLTEKEEAKLYEELGELDETVNQCSELLAHVYKRRQAIYKLMDW